ncbi:hypothetical protein HOY82DRAFT_668743 [Tuber indicum]|nr:hypothetical protein HOY82DRAFT_668743 [Tuber indicum]
MDWTTGSAVYCDVDGNADRREELAAAMASLTTAARSISPVKVRTDAKPKTVFTNEPGCSLLLSLQTTASEIDVWRKKTEEQHRGLQEVHKKTEALSEEVTILRPLKGTAVDIRNNRAHTRDVYTDVSLFRNKLIRRGDTFTALYGLHWCEAGELLEHKYLVYSMNKRATAVMNGRRWRKEEEFRKLVLWTRNATTMELAEFRNDVAGRMYHKHLFLSIKYSR